jgi:hypothetical protein
VGLSYAAPAGCPDVDGYASHVRARSSTLTLEPNGVPSADSVDVKVEPAPGASGWVGRVTIVGAQALDREVRGERCEDVVAALALITVLRLEGVDASATRRAPAGSTANGAGTSGAAAADAAATASTRAGESSSSQAGVPPAPGVNPAPAAPSRPATESNTSAGAAASEEPPTLAPEAAERVEPAPSESAASKERDAGTGAREEQARAERRGAADGSGPDAARAGVPEPRARASAESELDSSPSGSGDASPDERESAVGSEPRRSPTVSVGAAAQAGYASIPANAFKGLLQGELRLGEGMSSWATTLSFAYARGTSEIEIAKLDITLVTAELALCPPAFIDATRVWLRACAGVRGGGVHFVVTSNDPNQDPGATWRPWLAVGPSLQLGVPLGGRWAVRGVFDLAVQLIRDRFDVERQVEVMDADERLTLYRPQAVSVELGLALGYTF